MHLLNCVSYIVVMCYLATGSNASAIVKREAPLEGYSMNNLTASDGSSEKDSGVALYVLKGGVGVSTGDELKERSAIPIENNSSPSNYSSTPVPFSNHSSQSRVISSTESSTPTQSSGLPSHISSEGGDSSRFVTQNLPSRPYLQYGVPSHPSHGCSAHYQSYNVPNTPSAKHGGPSQSYSFPSSPPNSYETQNPIPYEVYADIYQNTKSSPVRGDFREEYSVNGGESTNKEYSGNVNSGNGFSDGAMNGDSSGISGWDAVQNYRIPSGGQLYASNGGYYY